MNKRQSKQLLELETSLEKQREKTALAEKATLYLERLIKEPRTIDRAKADEILFAGEKGSVKLFVSMIGDEPDTLAKQLADILHSHGWQIISAELAIPGTRRTGILVRGYGETGVNLVGTDWTGAPEPAKTLHRFLVECVIGNPVVETRISPDGPKDSLEVTIAAKY